MSLNLKQESDKCYSSTMGGSYNSRSLYGGVILGQAVMAAYNQVKDDMFLHSMNVYFLQRGSSKLRTDYIVDSMLDGRSYCKRSVTVQQNESIIAKVQLSFKIDEPDSKFQFYSKFPDNITHYSKLEDSLLLMQKQVELSSDNKVLVERLKGYLWWLTDFPIATRPIDPDINLLLKPNKNNTMSKWVKLKDETLMDMSHRSAIHCLLAFLSDFGVLQPILTLNYTEPVGFMVSLDHAMWFHQHNFDPLQWFLFQSHCVHANNGTTVNSGSLWSENGELLATFMQEGIVRPQLTKM